MLVYKTYLLPVRKWLYHLRLEMKCFLLCCSKGLCERRPNWLRQNVPQCSCTVFRAFMCVKMGFRHKGHLKSQRASSSPGQQPWRLVKQSFCRMPSIHPVYWNVVTLSQWEHPWWTLYCFISFFFVSLGLINALEMFCRLCSHTKTHTQYTVCFRKELLWVEQQKGTQAPT